MKKLLELEKRLIEAKEELSKIMSSSTTAPGSVNTTGGPSIASQIGFGKGEELSEGQKKLDADKDGKIESSDLAALRSKKKMKKAEHPDEKEDKKLIAEAMDRHNEQKHGEKKGENSAFKNMKKSDEISRKKPAGPANPTEGKKQQFVDTVINQARKPAKVTNAAGEVTEVSPEQQVKAKKDSADAKKAKFEAEAAARRAKMKLNKSEEISYLENGQWSLEKARVLSFPSGNVLADMGQPKQTTPPAGKLRDADTPPPVPGSEQARPAPVDDSNLSSIRHKVRGMLQNMQVSSRDHLPDDSQWPRRTSWNPNDDE